MPLFFSACDYCGFGVPYYKRKWRLTCAPPCCCKCKQFFYCDDYCRMRHRQTQHVCWYNHFKTFCGRRNIAREVVFKIIDFVERPYHSSLDTYRPLLVSPQHLLEDRMTFFLDGNWSVQVATRSHGEFQKFLEFLREDEFEATPACSPSSSRSNSRSSYTYQ